MTNINSLTGKLLMAFLFLGFFAVSLSPELAMASGNGQFISSLCNAYNCFFGNDVVVFIGTIAIIFLGIGAFFGKLNWGLVIVVVIGIIVIGGAGQFAAMVVGNGATNPCGTPTDSSC